MFIQKLRPTQVNSPIKFELSQHRAKNKKDRTVENIISKWGQSSIVLTSPSQIKRHSFHLAKEAKSKMKTNISDVKGLFSKIFHSCKKSGKEEEGVKEAKSAKQKTTGPLNEERGFEQEMIEFKKHIDQATADPEIQKKCADGVRGIVESSNFGSALGDLWRVLDKVTILDQQGHPMIEINDNVWNDNKSEYKMNIKNRYYDEQLIHLLTQLIVKYEEPSNQSLLLNSLPKPDEKGFDKFKNWATSPIGDKTVDSIMCPKLKSVLRSFSQRVYVGISENIYQVEYSSMSQKSHFAFTDGNKSKFHRQFMEDGSLICIIQQVVELQTWDKEKGINANGQYDKKTAGHVPFDIYIHYDENMQMKSMETTCGEIF